MHLHLKRSLFTVNFSKPLSEKYKKRNFKVISGDKVKILRGQFRGKEGKIERIDTKNVKLYITGLEVVKKDGTKVQVPLHPSNVQILELELKDKLRKQKLEGKK